MRRLARHQHHQAHPHRPGSPAHPHAPQPVKPTPDRPTTTRYPTRPATTWRRNAKAVPEMERLQGVFDEAEGFDAWLEQTAHGVQTLTLSAFGIAEQELESLARQTFTAGRMDNNPVAFTTDDVLEILHENL